MSDWASAQWSSGLFGWPVKEGASGSLQRVERSRHQGEVAVGAWDGNAIPVTLGGGGIASPNADDRANRASAQIEARGGRLDEFGFPQGNGDPVIVEGQRPSGLLRSGAGKYRHADDDEEGQGPGP